MVFRDGSGSASIPGLHGTAFGAVHSWDASPVTPAASDRPPTRTPTLRALISAAAGGPSAVEWQVSTVSSFASTVWTGSDAAVPNGYAVKNVTFSLTNLTLYYWRVRAGDGAGTWGLWSAAVPFTPDLSAGRGFLEIFENVGIAPAGADEAVLEVYINQGVIAPVKVGAADYIFENVGPNFGLTPGAFDYIYLGDVSTNTPTPGIWFLDPDSGRAGDGIKIYGFGTGALQATYGGTVEAYFGAGVGWVSVPVLSWGIFPATANALTAARRIDPAAGVVDPQHSVIEIVVAPAALPPGYPLRIRTEGP